MDWAGLWKFLSDSSFYIYLIIFFGGGALLRFFKNIYEARQERLETVANARVREKELQLEIEKERNKPKGNPITVDDIVAEERSYEGYRENVPQQQQ